MPEPVRPDLEARLLRPRDLVALTLEAYHCRLEADADGGQSLVADADAALLLWFPPQHLGEEVWQQQTGAGLAGPPERPSLHRSAEPSRVVFALPEGSRIGWGIDAILAALPELEVLVSPAATPRGEAGGKLVPPEQLETAVEAPYRMIVSPARGARLRPGPNVAGAEGHSGLWRASFTAGPDGVEPVVRGLWARDQELPDPGFTMPLTPQDRIAIVEQTNGEGPFAETPLTVKRFALSALGAWLDWSGYWEGEVTVAQYAHEAQGGRDGYVRVAYPGILFPFGHRCLLVKVSERQIRHREDPVAYLWQRWFIVLREPVRNYPFDDPLRPRGAGRSLPFDSVRITPLVTPDIDTPADPSEPFVVMRLGAPYPFGLETLDRAGATGSFAAPLVFIRGITERGTGLRFLVKPEQAPGAYWPVSEVAGRAQNLALAVPVKRGDTSVEVATLRFTGEVDEPNFTAWPSLAQVTGVFAAMRHLAPAAPTVTASYNQTYLDEGLPARSAAQRTSAGPNPGELLLDLAASAGIDFSGDSDASGGFVSPSLAVKGLSRALGAVGNDPVGLAGGSFDPSTFFGAALLPKLFGLFNLTEILQPAGLDEAPAFITDAAGVATKLVSEVTRLLTELAAAASRMEDEVAKAAHGGAAAIAEDARAALLAATTPPAAAGSALLTSLGGLPGSAGDLPGLVSALLTTLDGVATAARLPGIPTGLRARIEALLGTVRGLLESAADITRVLADAASGKVTARLEWRPRISPWGIGAVKEIFNPGRPDVLGVDVVVEASTDKAPKVDITAEIVDFDLNLIGSGDGGLMQLRFRRIGFHAGSSGKAEVDVVFGGIRFLGPLAFVDTLRELIPFDGFSDPPFVDVRPDGVTAGFDLALPNVGVGVFSLENISLGADARVPFLGDALTVGFHFCRKDSPFRLTVLCIGGGGWLELRAAPKGLVLLELGLEAAASLSVDLGVASGSVSIAVGAYLRLEGEKGSFTAYFRIRGEVDVLGLISASITLELSLTYDFATDKLHGRASLVIEVEVLFFSASVELVVERQLAGSRGDPTMKDQLPPDAAGDNADWAAYCNAFAPV